MIDTVILMEGGQERRLGVADFPLALGGSGADIQLLGVHASEPVAWLGLEQGSLFIQPLDSPTQVVCNGALVQRSQWLHEGDRVAVGDTRIDVAIDQNTARLTVEHEVADVGTELPVMASATPPSEDAATAPGPQSPMIDPAAFTPRAPGRGSQRRGPRRGVVLTWVTVALLGLGGWFLFGMRSVDIRIEPAPERLVLEGGVAWKIAGTHLLRPGTYQLIAEATGHYSLDTTLAITDESSQVFALSMRRLPGVLVVDVWGAEGVVVRIDGAAVGVTPLGPLELAPGEHEVQLESERYDEFSTRVTLAGGGRTDTLSARLVPRWAAVDFASDPAGATVRVDGVDRGVTPLALDLLAGRHVYELRLAGHQSFYGTLEVEARRSQSLPSVELAPAMAKLLLTSRPPNAVVTVGGAYSGETPVVLALTPRTDHEIVLSRTGYGSASSTVRLAPDQTDSLRLELPRLMGEIRFDVDPADAELLVNGESQGRADQVLDLPAEALRFEIRKDGYESYSGSLTPKPGLAQSVQVRLRTEAEIQAQKTPPRITSSQGQDLVLIQGGRMRMGAPRREPGRRSNEALREVELTRPYYLSVTEVSNEQFRAFQPQHRSGGVGRVNLEIDHHPVVRVSWEDAARYCNWLSQQESLPAAYRISGQEVAAVQPLTTGYRLPTEAEWAWAARYGGQEQAGAKYPWGEGLPVPPRTGNYAGLRSRIVLPTILAGYEDGFAGTSPIDSFMMNVLGIYNMGGNVAEWVHDHYTVYSTQADEVVNDPTGPPQGRLHTIRGSSWMDAMITDLRLSYRDYGGEPRPDLGFRLARYAE